MNSELTALGLKLDICVHLDVQGFQLNSKFLSFLFCIQKQDHFIYLLYKSAKKTSYTPRKPWTQTRLDSLCNVGPSNGYCDILPRWTLFHKTVAC